MLGPRVEWLLNHYPSESQYSAGKHAELLQGIAYAKGTLELYEPFSDIPGQGISLERVIFKRATSSAPQKPHLEQSTQVSSDEDDKFQLCRCRRLLGNLCHSKYKTWKAVDYSYPLPIGGETFQRIQEEMSDPVATRRSDVDGEFPRDCAVSYAY